MNDTGDAGAMQANEGLAEGRPEAFERVYRAELRAVMLTLVAGFHYRSAGASKYLRVDSASDAEEICQEAFAQFFTQCRRGRFDPSRPVRPYLRRITMNIALRKMGRLSREVPTELVDIGPAPEQDTVEQRERAALLSEFKGRLDDEEREVMSLYFEASGATQAEVGKKIGRSRDHVYRVAMRIRQQAKEFFAAKGWFDE
ncbi:MAG: sigma-70 family RNA polymerase sigma factor [Deltaproteobacteria bacterium]